MFTHAAGHVLAAVLAIPGAPAPAPAPDDPPDGIAATDISSEGDGCRSSGVALTDGNRRLEFRYGALEAQAGMVLQDNGSVTWVQSQRRSCRISLTLTYPAGWRLTTYRSAFQTWADLAAGARGTVRGEHRRGAWPMEVVTGNVGGPVGSTITHQQSVKRHHACGVPTPITFAKELIVDGGSVSAADTSELAADIGEKYDQLDLSWSRC
ncbi:hypothetical protein GCM10010124_03190 [Pilimelia terevasa]|uniref:DUF4360 domain-containing protein n=1 Tax=Pilimelia terevasa TaxID=53372 RepID=A0A8J3BGU0_9ACTN|nr:DUF4360 domain-containing protein [Pilimelia terevasa]GGK13954.1 hypothetical protein GCM10010124_03190 [Pilimelia terevasa]